MLYVENLAKLRDFLMANKVEFDIDDFRTHVDEDGHKEATQLTLDELEAGMKSCGTAGCAIGWAPFVVEPDLKHFQSEYCYRLHGNIRTINMWDYTKDKFVSGDMPDFRRVFDWPFGHEWKNHDNTREGAAYRIDVLIQTGEVPSFFNALQLSGMHDTTKIHWFEQYAKDRDAWIEKYRAA